MTYDFNIPANSSTTGNLTSTSNATYWEFRCSMCRLFYYLATQRVHWLTNGAKIRLCRNCRDHLEKDT